MENLKYKLGMRIKYLRKISNMTQEQLSEKIDMDITTLSKIETGKNYPQHDTVEKIAKALNIEVHNIFNFSQNYSETEYIQAINQNLTLLKNNKEKLKFIYEISSRII